MEIFYIETTVNEHGDTRIPGYFTSFVRAHNALKECSNHCGELGAGYIYRVETDKLNAEPELVQLYDTVLYPELEKLLEESKPKSRELDGIISDASFCAEIRNLYSNSRSPEERREPKPYLIEDD